jgi:hypothetical protein
MLSEGYSHFWKSKFYSMFFLSFSLFVRIVPPRKNVLDGYAENYLIQTQPNETDRISVLQYL